MKADPMEMRKAFAMRLGSGSMLWVKIGPFIPFWRLTLSTIRIMATGVLVIP
jgi:hypothetical protein